MLTHDWLDCARGFVGVIKWNGRDVVVEDMGFDDAVEQITTNPTKLTVDSRCGATSKIPSVRLIVWKGRICVLEVRDRDYQPISITCYCKGLGCDLPSQ